MPRHCDLQINAEQVVSWAQIDPWWSLQSGRLKNIFPVGDTKYVNVHLAASMPGVILGPTECHPPSLEHIHYPSSTVDASVLMEINSLFQVKYSCSPESAIKP